MTVPEPRPRPALLAADVEVAVFDMDGTLADTTLAVADGYAAVVERVTGRRVGPPEVVPFYYLGTPRAILGALLGRPALQQEVDDYHQAFGEALAARDVRPYEGIPQTLDTLAARMPLGLFTGASFRSAELVLAQTGLAGRFAAVVGGDQVPEAKPAPDGLLEALRQLDRSASTAAYVGDSPLDLRCARNAGSFAVAAGWGHLVDPQEPHDLLAGRPEDLLALAAGPRATRG